MKTNYIFRLLTLAVAAMAFAFVTSCEGPQGPAGPAGTNGTNGTNGTDGTNGVDGNNSCLSCHNTETKAIVAEQFAASQHSSGAIAVDYAGGRASCARCHSHEGYLEFARTGAVAANIANPSAWQCSTCHAIHTDFAENDYAFRLGDPVVLIANSASTIDAGNNNTCVNCHQARRNVGSYAGTEDKTYTRKFTGDDIATYTTAAVGPAGTITLVAHAAPATDTLTVVFDVPLATHLYINSTHAGPHHGPQANLWNGEAGSAAGTPFAAHSDGCVKCHMGPDSGHSYWPEEGNCQVDGCHGSSKQASLDAIAARVAAVGAKLEAAHAIHLDDAKAGYVYGNVHPVYASLETDVFNAWWDFTLILEDRSNGAHNPAYVDSLLKAAEAALGI